MTVADSRPPHRAAIERQLWLAQHRPFNTCPRGTALGVGAGGEQLGGCPTCWSPRFWRVACTCGWASRWVDAAVPGQGAAARAAWADHHPDADLGGWALLGVA